LIQVVLRAGVLAAQAAITAAKSLSMPISNRRCRTLLRSECEMCRPSSGMTPRSSGSIQ
jgi:hypothetical protein